MQHPKILRVFMASLFAFLMLCLVPAAASAQQYRVFWVDMYNTKFNNHTNTMDIVNNAVAANANALFIQVRRRGDSWYLGGLEPLPDTKFGFGPLAPNYDPLADLITEAHGRGIEVHAYVIVGAVWDKHPTVLGVPTDPNHVFNLHGWDATTKWVRTGPDGWLTRSLISDGTGGITFGGTRFGSDFWIDLGHPDAAEFTYDVFMDIVRRYEIDGLHLDRIRYPDFSVSGQTPSSGTSIGYNAVSVARFNHHYGLADNNVPAQNDPLWSQWRRDQVTDFVRRVYLNAVAIRPQIKVSASLIAYGGGPITEADWQKAEAYWRVYQDWRAWTQEGVLDIAAPMNYKRDHDTAQKRMLDSWNEWTKNHQYGRAGIAGLGSYLNSVECTLRQIRRSLAPSAAGNSLAGVSFFSMATTNVAVTNNPCAYPATASTPLRSFAEFGSALQTGKSIDATKFYEDPVANPVPVFPFAVNPPAFAWKLDPKVGHLMGIIRDSDSTVVDTGAVAILRDDDGTTPPTGRTGVAVPTDGNGFYGGIDLAPGKYHVTVQPAGQAPYTYQCAADVSVGQVTSFDFTIDRNAPLTSLAQSAFEIWPPNNQMVPVTISGTATDTGSGLDSITFRVRDEYGTIEPLVEAVDGQANLSLDWSRTFYLEASRDGNDKDGRVYTVEITLKDRACNATTKTVQLIVPHDQRVQ